MIPVSIIIKILQETGWIVYIGKLFAPLMRLTGLPGEMGLVFGTAILSNIFGGLIAFSSIARNIPLTIAQTTVLATMILVAHNFLMEITVAYKAGARILPMILIRLGTAFLIGILLNFFYSFTHSLEMPMQMPAFVPRASEQSLIDWALGELQKYAGVVIIIFALIFSLEILKRIGFINLLTRLLTPIVNVLGINANVVPVTIIGMTLGLAYGGAIIINESRNGQISKKDIFYSLFLMGILHSIIEDTFLMLSIGAHYSGILVFRALLAFSLTFLIVRLTRNWDDRKMKYLIR